MKGLKKELWSVDKTWSIFLDRDGTINTHIEDHYISDWKDFEFIPGAIEAISVFNKIFGKVFIVTNQQGIGKEIMSHQQLFSIHEKMIAQLADHGAYVNEIYYCPELAFNDPPCRKPNPGMAFQAQQDFPDIRFRKSIMIGDQVSDIQFGQKVQMKTVFVHNNKLVKSSFNGSNPDFSFVSIWEFAQHLLDKNPIT